MQVLQQSSVQLPNGKFQRTVPLKAHEVKCGGGVTLKPIKKDDKPKKKLS